MASHSSRWAERSALLRAAHSGYWAGASSFRLLRLLRYE